MKNRLFVTMLALSVLLACTTSAALADGQETGVIVGTVTEAAGTPLPGVVVTAEAGRGPQTAVTDQNGEYRFALLVPGQYTVTAEMDGFEAVRGTTMVSGGKKAQVDLKLSMGTSEEITVTSEAPMVDKFNVTAGATVSAEIGKETAGSTRTYYGVINTLPGVSSDAQNENIQGTRPTVNGTNWADQQVFIDGVDTSFARFGGSRVLIPTSAVTEVTMEAGGSSAEYGRAIGSTTNVIVKSGTNRFHGDALYQRQEVSWGADYATQPALANRQSFPRDPNFLRRSSIEEDNGSNGFEFGFGGPVARDKAWFFLAWSDVDTNDIDKTLNGDPIDASLNTEARIAKFNLQPSQRHSFSLSWIDTPADRVYFNPESFDKWTPTPHVSDGTVGTATWNWSVTNDVFMEAKIATQESTENKFLACGSIDPAVCLAEKQQDPRFPPNALLGPHLPGNNYSVYIDGADDGSWHNGWLLDNGFGTNEFPRDQANVSLTQFVGSNHELKYGVDWQEVQWDANINAVDRYDGAFFDVSNPFGFSSASGGIGIQDCGVARTDDANVALLNFFGIPASRAIGTCAFTRIIPGVETGNGSTKNEDLALYLRDRFTVGDHWTFNLGARLESAVAKNDADRKVVDAENFAPRLSATYDVRGDGKMLFSANVGRYYAQLNQQWIQEHLLDRPNGELGQSFQTILFCDAADVILGACGSIGYNFVLRELRAGRQWQLVDQGFWNSDIKPYYKDEIILGFEWQVTNNWAFDTKAIYWELGDMIGATIQVSPFGDQFKFVANYEDYPTILRQIDDARVAMGGQGLFQDNTLLDDYREGLQEYGAIQLQLNRRFANGWALFNNVTISETNTTGSGAWWNNTNSDYGTELHVALTENDISGCHAANARPSAITGNLPTVPVDCEALRGFLGQSVSTINREGRAGSIDRPVIFNSFGFKTWNFGRHDFTAGGHLSFQSGSPWGRTGSVSTISLDGNQAASSSVGLNFEETGDRRLASHYTLNLSASWGFPLFNDVRGGLRIEGLNVTDQQRQVFINNSGEVQPVRRFFQRPRQIRASLSLTF